jgi:hypothetical protein
VVFSEESQIEPEKKSVPSVKSVDQWMIFRSTKSPFSPKEDMMSLTNPDRKAPTGRIVVAAIVTLVIAVIGNLVLGLLATSLLDIPPNFEPLTPVRYSFLTVMGVLGGIVVFLYMTRKSGKPVRAFQRIAWITLALSMLPTLGLYFSQAMPGTTLAGVLVLMLMHVIAALPVIYILPAYSRAK